MRIFYPNPAPYRKKKKDKVWKPKKTKAQKRSGRIFADAQKRVAKHCRGLMRNIPVDPRKDEFLMSDEWRRLRIEIIQEQGARCRCCGATPSDGVTVINVDHIKPRKNYPELALTKSNLQVLCNACNHGKGNREYDFINGKRIIKKADVERGQ